MNSDYTYAFYGSLRRGMSNFAIYHRGLEYLYSARLKGFKLFSMGAYPCAVETNALHDSIAVEIFKIRDRQIETSIHEMELEVGYYFTDILINNNKVGIYLFRSGTNYPEVSDGDWVEFFRKKLKS